MGTDYFTRIREGESNMEWVRIVGSLTVTNAAAGSNEVVRLLTENGTEPRMSLVGDHLWRYHYPIPTNGIGARLTFRLEAKEYYTNATDSATWHVRTNELYTLDEEIGSLPYTSTLVVSNALSSAAKLHEMSVVLDENSTHLKIEYNDEQGAFAFSHASYQDFGKWTDAIKNFVGHAMITNGTDVISDSGVSEDKQRYPAPFDDSWELPSHYNSSYWTEEFPGGEITKYGWFSVGKTPNGWTAHNARYVQNARDNINNMALAIDGDGEGALATENFSEGELPLGLESVSFTARISQPIEFDDFATYMDGLTCKNYAISAKVTMSQDYEATGHYPKDVSPVNPSVSFIGYHRGKQGCYEFRMTRHKEDKIQLELYKWTRSGSKTKAERLCAPVEVSSKLMPTSSQQATLSQWTTAYFLVYTLSDGTVRLEGHLNTDSTTTGIKSDIGAMRTSKISYVDPKPGTLASGGSYGVGSTDCHAGFGSIRIHENMSAPTATTDAVLVIGGDEELVGRDKLFDEWDYYGTRWEVANYTAYKEDGCLLSVVPTNQAIQVWVSDARAGTSSGWTNTCAETIINSFTTNRFTVSPKMSGTWKVRLQTKEGEDAGVVLDDVSISPWEGLNVWGRDDHATSTYNTNWAFTKCWLSNKVATATSTSTRKCLFQPSRGSANYPMGLRSPIIQNGLSLFSYTYENADSNCVMLVQIATNMTPRDARNGTGVTALTDLTESSGNYIWTTVATNDFRTMDPPKRKGDTITTFISLRQHWIRDEYDNMVFTNVCGLIRVIVDPAIVKKVVGARAEEHESLENYGNITITAAHCYNEPAIGLKSWFGWNVHTEGWDGSGNASPYAYLTDYPDGLSIALNFSSKKTENQHKDAQGIGLAEPGKEAEYAQQNPFVQCAALTNGIGTVSFRARLFDTNLPPKQTPAVITLYGGTDPGTDQPTTDSATWDILTNFVVKSSTYQPFEWSYKKSTESPYKAVRLSAAGARWGRKPASLAKDWEWGNLPASEYYEDDGQINRACIDEMSVSELIVPRLKFMEVRPFRTNLGMEDICVIDDIMDESEQPLIGESWGIQCRVEPAQMANELDIDSITVYMDVFRGKYPWGYEQWKDMAVDGKKRFRAQLARVGDTLVYRSHTPTVPEATMPPETEVNTVYQYAVFAEYRKLGDRNVLTNVLSKRDWTRPAWYRGNVVDAGNASEDKRQFSAYTILDSISPHRAWVNEVNYVEGSPQDNTKQFIEMAVPQAADISGWRLVATSMNKGVVPLCTFGVDRGVESLISKTGGSTSGVLDATNDYTFVSVCSPASWVEGKYDGSWNNVTGNTVNEGTLRYQNPYGIQLVRPSGIIEHEFVVQGTDGSKTSSWYASYKGEVLRDKLLEDQDDGQWFYAGEELADANTSLGVWRSHGEDPSCWTNYMDCTPGALNRLKDGTWQDIPPGWFLTPNGTNVWIHSNLADEFLTQYFGGKELPRNAVIVIPNDRPTNIVLSVTNWYQIGNCTTNAQGRNPEQVANMRGQIGTNIVLYLGIVTNNLTINIGTEPQSALTEKWGLTPENRYTPAVLSWLRGKYGTYGTNDLSSAELRTLDFKSTTPPTRLSLTEMYWLDIPPVHSKSVYGGSNIWFVASMGAPDSAHLQTIEPNVKRMSDGSIRSNVYVTVTMMITNTTSASVSPRAWPPYQMNGVTYDGEGSSNYTGSPKWTNVVFNIKGALQKDDVKNNYYPLQQYVFTPDSFGDPDNTARRFQTRVEVVDPYTSGTMGLSYDWARYRDVYPIWYRWSIEDNPDGRTSISPLVPNWKSPVPTP